MYSQLSPRSRHDEAEMEWLLCWASALQASKRSFVNLTELKHEDALVATPPFESDAAQEIDSLRTSITPNPITGYVVNSSGLGISGVTVSILDSANNTVATATTDI